MLHIRAIQVALLSPFVQREVLRSGHGVSESDPVILPKQVRHCHWGRACMQHSGMLPQVSRPAHPVIVPSCSIQSSSMHVWQQRIYLAEPQVTHEVLKLLLTYCRYHRVPGHSDKERKAFDEKFIRLDTRRLCELTSAADR